MNRLFEIEILFKKEITTNGITEDNTKAYQMKLNTLGDYIERLHMQLYAEKNKPNKPNKTKFSTIGRHNEKMNEFDKEIL
jgi:hypothetical protein